MRICSRLREQCYVWFGSRVHAMFNKQQYSNLIPEFTHTDTYVHVNKYW